MISENSMWLLNRYFTAFIINFVIYLQNEEKNDEPKSEKINGSKQESAENGHKNEKSIERVDNM